MVLKSLLEAETILSAWHFLKGSRVPNHLITSKQTEMANQSRLICQSTTCQILNSIPQRMKRKEINMPVTYAFMFCMNVASKMMMNKIETSLFRVQHPAHSHRSKSCKHFKHYIEHTHTLASSNKRAASTHILDAVPTTCCPTFAS